LLGLGLRPRFDEQFPRDQLEIRWLHDIRFGCCVAFRPAEEYYPTPHHIQQQIMTLTGSRRSFRFSQAILKWTHLMAVVKVLDADLLQTV